MNARQLIAIFLCVASLAQAQSTAGVVEKPHGKFWKRCTRKPPSLRWQLQNNNRTAGLIRAGKLYLTVQDAIAIALENNLDLEIARYGPISADWRYVRAQAGGPSPRRARR